MKNLKFTLSVFAIAICAAFSSASAQVSLSGGSDLVSSYVWRGTYVAGASVQPYAELAVDGFAVGAWGSTAIDPWEVATVVGSKEIDCYVSYGLGGFSAMITDYWCSTQGALFDDGHVLEATLGYTISEDFPLSLAVSYNFYGDDDNSAYIALSYPLTIGEVGLDLAAGLTPTASVYSPDGAAICSLSARVSKSVALSSDFELPLFVDAIVNPDSDQAFLLAGLSLSF